MSKADPKPRPWACKCGNILGVMHRNSHKIMVLDAFRSRVTDDLFLTVLKVFTNRNYGVMNLGYGDVPCAKCGRLNRWDASQKMLELMLARRKERNEKTDAIIDSHLML